MNNYLIDYENVTDVVGLRGTKYLGPEDHLVVFYSNTTRKIRNDIWEEIVNSGCTLDIFKLINARPNALDFYIASEAATMCARGENRIALISHDKDMTSISEFLRLKWKDSDLRIFRAPSLEEAMSQMDEASGSERRKAIAKSISHLNLDVAYLAYSIKSDMKKKVHYAIKESGYGDLAEAAEDLIGSDCALKASELYNRCRSEFGSVRGCAIYRILKESLFDDK